jgi:hypothetical protein
LISDSTIARDVPLHKLQKIQNTHLLLIYVSDTRRSSNSQHTPYYIYLYRFLHERHFSGILCTNFNIVTYVALDLRVPLVSLFVVVCCLIILLFVFACPVNDSLYVL